MKKVIGGICLLCLYCVSPYGYAKEAPSACPRPAEFMAMPAPSFTEKAWVASRLYADIKYRFAHMESLSPAYHFDEYYQNYLKEIDNAPTRFVFDKASAKLFASLHNGHTRFYDKIAGCNPNLPFKADFIEGKWLVTQSRITSLTVGSEILSINGEDFPHWADQQLSYLPDSSLRSQRHILTFRGYGAWLWPQSLTLILKNPGQTPYKISINRNNTFSDTKKPSYKGRYEPEEGVHLQTLNHNMIRITVSGFDHPENEAAILKAIQEHQDASAILFDLRQTEGGMSPIQLILSLAEHPFQDTLAYTPQHIAANDALSDLNAPEYSTYPNTWMRYGGEILYPHPIYHGKIFILTDEGCDSACETFVMTMKIAKRATLLGSSTWGMNGNTAIVNVPNSLISYNVGTENVLWPDGSSPEGVGVSPDINIPLTQRELLEGKDMVLQTALSKSEALMKETQHVH